MFMGSCQVNAFHHNVYKSGSILGIYFVLKCITACIQFRVYIYARKITHMDFRSDTLVSYDMLPGTMYQRDERNEVRGRNKYKSILFGVDNRIQM